MLWNITEPKVSESRSVVPTLWGPLDYTVHRILQARILEWVAFPCSRGSSQPRDWTQVSRTADGFFTSWATREAWAKVNLGTKTRFNISIVPFLQGALEHWVDCHECNKLSFNCSLLESLLSFIMPTNLAIMS